MSFFGGSSSSNPSPVSMTPSASTDLKAKIIQTLQAESNMANAKVLIQKINENCFTLCVPSPSTSLSGKESTCIATCMDKYIDAWNTVQKTYMARIQREAPAAAAAGGLGGLS